MHFFQINQSIARVHYPRSATYRVAATCDATAKRSTNECEWLIDFNSSSHVNFATTVPASLLNSCAVDDVDDADVVVVVVASSMRARFADVLSKKNNNKKKKTPK
jgi:hypothetical protein